MSRTLFSGPISGLSALAKGRGGGGSSSGISSINDSWNAPATVKAQMAFEIIWFVASLVQLIYIIKKLRLIPAMSARLPYILLAVVTLCSTISYLLWAIFTRVADDVDYTSAQGMDLALTFLFGVTYALRPAVVLWLVHQRAGVLRATNANAPVPVGAQVWKRIVDWVLVGLVFLFFIVLMGLDGSYYAAANNYTLTSSQYSQYIQSRRGITHTAIAFMILLLIDVIASVTTMFVQGKTAKWADSVVGKLLAIVVPFVAINALELLATDIYSATTLKTRSLSDSYSLNLAQIIIEGVCAIGITAGLIITMSLPGVQWTAQGSVPGGYPATPGQQPQWATPNSGWTTQPLYNQQPQQAYTPQQSPSNPPQSPYNPPQSPYSPPQQPYSPPQQPYYPQQQTYFQQPQQPYTVPAHAGPH